MRVSNEQAKMLSMPDCIKDMCDVCSTYYFCQERGGALDLASDLVEARELMNKVREDIGQLGLTYKGGGVEAVCNNILENTKEYAE